MIIDKKEDLLRCIRNELVPENPKVKHTGIKGLLEYRLNNNISHPDSIYKGYDKHKCKYYGESKTSDYFRAIYNIDPFKIGSSDTIFNCWSFISRFFNVEVGHTVSEKDVLFELEKYFIAYDSIKLKLDKLADYHHCLSNFMPAPKGFNGYSFIDNRTNKKYEHDGKGNYYRDNDFPDIFYKRAENDDKLYQYYQWINKNMDSFCLNFFKEFKSYLSDCEANHPVDVNNEKDLENFEKGLDNAIKCIEIRAEELFRKMKSL